MTQPHEPRTPARAGVEPLGLTSISVAYTDNGLHGTVVFRCGNQEFHLTPLEAQNTALTLLECSAWATTEKIIADAFRATGADDAATDQMIRVIGSHHPGMSTRFVRESKEPPTDGD